jgi:hypothetical protein
MSQTTLDDDDALVVKDTIRPNISSSPVSSDSTISNFIASNVSSYLADTTVQADIYSFLVYFDEPMDTTVTVSPVFTAGNGETAADATALTNRLVVNTEWSDASFFPSDRYLRIKFSAKAGTAIASANARLVISGLRDKAQNPVSVNYGVGAAAEKSKLNFRISF